MSWREEFDNYKLEENGKWKIERAFTKQFITDLRNKDEEELIKIVDNNGSIGEIREEIINYYNE